MLLLWGGQWTSHYGRAVGSPSTAIFYPPDIVTHARARWPFEMRYNGLSLADTVGSRLRATHRRLHCTTSVYEVAGAVDLAEREQGWRMGKIAGFDDFSRENEDGYRA